MKFLNYIHEDYESTREYKKTIFDLEVALGELEYAEGEKVPTEHEKRTRLKEKIQGLKERIVRLKAKILTLAREGIEIKPALQDLLDKIPDMKQPEGEEEDKEDKE